MVQNAVMIADLALTKTPSSPLRVAVVDPSTAVRTGLPLALPSFTFAAMYESCATALSEHPLVDVLVLEVNASDGGLPGQRDIDNVTAFVSAGYRVCIYTLDRRPYFLARCLWAGAHGVVLKSDSLDDLVECLRRVARGETAVSHGVTLPDATAGSAIPLLTKRQQQVLAGRARGESFHSIARRLEISERTAQDHWSAIAHHFQEFLRSHSAADLERTLGLDPGAAPLASNMT